MTKQYWPYPRIVAHRGGGKLAPENTLAGIDCGHQYGQRMIEVDAKLSSDQQIFLLHDDTLNRTTSAQGMAGEISWQELRQFDAGSCFSQSCLGGRLPSLAEVAERCRCYLLSPPGLFMPLIRQPLICPEACYWITGRRTGLN